MFIISKTLPSECSRDNDGDENVMQGDDVPVRQSFWIVSPCSDKNCELTPRAQGASILFATYKSPLMLFNVSKRRMKPASVGVS